MTTIDRYSAIAASMAYEWPSKVVGAITATIAIEAISYITGIYLALTKAPPILLFLCTSFVLLDWVTGIMAAKRRGEKIQSMGLRNTLAKVIEYSIFAYIGISLANGFEDTVFAPLTMHLGTVALLYIALTEGRSIIENLRGRDGAIALLRRIVQLLKSRSLEDLLVNQDDSTPDPNKAHHDSTDHT